MRAFNQRFSEKAIEQSGGKPWAEEQTCFTIKRSSESQGESKIEPFAEERVNEGR